MKGGAYKNSIIPPIAQSSIYTFKNYEGLDEYINPKCDKTVYAYGRGRICYLKNYPNGGRSMSST